jgi:hypothetical protein
MGAAHTGSVFRQEKQIAAVSTGEHPNLFQGTVYTLSHLAGPQFDKACGHSGNKFLELNPVFKFVLHVEPFNISPFHFTKPGSGDKAYRHREKPLRFS